MQTISSQGLDGLKGIDTNQVLTLTNCNDIVSAGFKFVMRYIGRESNHLYDITETEADTILSIGLRLGLVQHVESEKSWEPSKAKGTIYGSGAVHNARLLGYPVKADIWLDLEGVSTESTSDHVIDYCNSWYLEVAMAGYTPKLYVGWHSGLSSFQLYRHLKFQGYWSAYNLNTDEYPAVRGAQMLQSIAPSQHRIPGLAYQIDTIRRDRLSGLPNLAAA